MTKFRCFFPKPSRRSYRCLFRHQLKKHLEYFALLVENIRMWQKVAITHRRLYNERMKRAYITNLRPPSQLGIGEFCYLRVPYLSTITSHVKRLSIPQRGPFIISDILSNR